MKKSLRTMLCLVVILVLFLVDIKQASAENQKPKVNNQDLIYFVFTDRFYDGNQTNNSGVNKKDLAAYHGGDFQGIIDKLDYIKDLGFTAIWISPVVKNQIRGYHGYWAVDFYQTNEHFGTMEELKSLVNKSHEKGIKVIMDIVLNHTGQLHPWASEEEYKDWFHPKKTITDYNNQEQVENGWLAALPDFDQNNPEVRKYLIDMSKWWIKETGIDGFRLDTVRHIQKDFWKEFSEEIKKDYPDFYLMGEAFHGDVNYVADYQKNGKLDGLVDFPIYYAVNDVFKDGKSATILADRIKQTSSYADRNLMGTFIDNHDVPRFVSQLSKFKDEKLTNALTFMMTYTGIPVMYYGTEIGLDGGSDPDNRRDMDWSVKSPITDHVKKLVEIRKSNKALTEGDIQVLSSDSNFLCYSRTYEDKTVIVTFNTSGNSKKVEFKLPEASSDKYRSLEDLLSTRKVKIKKDTVSMTMEPMEANIFVYSTSVAGSILPWIIAGAVLLLTAFISFLYLRRKKK